MSNQTSTQRHAALRLALPATAVLLVGVGVGFWFGASGDAAKAIQSDSATDPADIARAAEFRSDPGRTINKQLDAFAGHSALRPTALNPGEPETAPGLARLHKAMTDGAAQRGNREKLVGELDRMHGAEPVDAAWSAQSEVDILSASINPAVLEAGMKPRDLDTDCRSHTCRISARFDNAADAETWGSVLVTQMGGTLSQVKMTSLLQPDGSYEVRMYGLRKQPQRS